MPEGRRFSIVDHSGDVGIDLEAPTLDDLFGVAAEAFADVICDRARLEPCATETIHLTADQPDLLLAAWLTELHYQFDVHDRIVAGATAHVSGDETAGYRLDATASFDPYDPNRHHIKVLVKAVTYHGLYVRGNGLWRARVIFDL